MNLRISFPGLTQRGPWLLILVAAIYSVAAFLQALNYPFISDDTLYIVTNKNLSELHLPELWRLFSQPYNPTSEFLPLRDFSYWIDVSLFGKNPAAYRLHNILLYLLCLPLVYSITANLWRYFRPQDEASTSWFAATVTALFALHPALVESIVWISGRKYILPDFFSMLALWLALKVKQECGLSSQYALATLLALIAVMLSKSSYVAMAPIVALLWLKFWLDIPLPFRRRTLLLWPLAILLLAAFLLLIFIARNNGYDAVPLYFGMQAFIRPFAILGGLAWLVISPAGRLFWHPVFEDPRLPEMLALGGAVLCAAGWGTVMFLRKRSPAGWVLMVFFLLCMPYLQLIPTKPPSMVSDRYIALAIWPAIFLVVLLAWRLRPLPRIVLLLLIALPWAYQTLERPRDWRSERTLVEVDYRAHPEYYVAASFKIGYQLQDGLRHEASETASHITSPEIRNALIRMIEADRVLRVDTVLSGNPQVAINQLLGLERILAHMPDQSKWDTPLMFAWLNILTDLSKEWKFLVERFPGDVAVRFNAGKYFFRISYYDDAITNLNAAIGTRLLPSAILGITYNNIGVAQMRIGHIADAENSLSIALKQSPPDLEAYCSLGELYTQMNRVEEATRAEINCLGSAFNKGPVR